MNALLTSVRFAGSVFDDNRIDHFRIVDGDRLAWSCVQTVRASTAERHRGSIERRIRSTFPDLGPVSLSETFGGGTGRSVQGVPQVGEIQPGVWIASGFGQFGMATSAMAAQLIVSGVFARDDRWRLFANFDLVWAGGAVGRMAMLASNTWVRNRTAVAAAWSRRRDRLRHKRELKAAKLARSDSEVKAPPDAY